MPALWRENYQMNLEGFNALELFQSLAENSKNFFGNRWKFYLRHLVEEGKKLYRPYTLSEA